MNLSKHNQVSLACVACDSKILSQLFEKNEYHFYKCNECGHLFVGNRPNQNDLDNFYRETDNLVINSQQRSSFKLGNHEKYSNNHWIVEIFKKRAPYKKLTILEIGPGDGSLLKELAELGHIVIGLDNGQYINSKNFFTELSEVSNFLESNSLKVDLLIMIDVIEHMNDPFSYFREFDHFTDGAELILSTPNAGSLQFKFMGLNWKMLVPPAHLHFFSYKSLEIFLKTNKFEVNYTFSRNPMRQFKYIRQFLRLFASLPFQFIKEGKSLIHYRTRVLSLKHFLLDFIKSDNHWIVAKHK
jgi:hypothetical protein